MAFRTSEIRLILTARNEVSRTLRRVARDVGSMDNIQQLRNQSQRLAIARNELITKRRIAAAEVDSLVSGQKYMAAEAKLSSAITARARAQEHLSKLSRDDQRNWERQLATARSLQRVKAQMANVDISEARRKDLQSRRAELLTRQSRLRGEQVSILGPQQAFRQRGAVDAELRARNAAATFKGLAAQADIARSRVRNLDDNLEHVSERIRQVDAAQRSLRWNSLQMGATMASHLGRVMATVGVVALFSLGLAAKGAADFNTQTMRAATQARPLGASVAATGKIAAGVMNQVTEQMKQFPATSEAMSDSFYEVFSGTNIQSVEEASKAVELFNKAAVAGSTDLQTMTDAGLTLYNNFTEGANRVGQLTERFDEFFAIVRFARTTPEQFAQSLSNVIPFAKAAGLSFRDVGEAMAVLTRATGRKFTSRDATGLFRQIELLARPEVIAGLKTYGVEVQDLTTGKMRPLRDILNDINERMVKTGDFKPGPDLLNFFKEVSKAGGAGEGSAGLAGTAQARRAFAFLLQNMGEYNLVAGQIAKDTDEFRKSYEALAKTPGVQWAVLTNQLKLFALQFGTEVIPVLVEVTRPLVAMLKAFNDMPPELRKGIATFVAFAAVAALVVGPLLMLTGGIVAFIARVKGVEKFAGATGAAGTLGKLATSAGLSTTALKASSKMASEAGNTLGRMVFRLTAITTALTIGVPLLLKYHDAILEATTGSEGFEGTLKLVEIALAAIAANQVFKLLARWAPSMASAGASAGTAAKHFNSLKLVFAAWLALSLRAVKGMFTLRGALLALSTMGARTAITIGLLGYALSKLIREIPYFDREMRQLGGAIYDLFNEPVAPAVPTNVLRDQVAAMKTEISELVKAGVPKKRIIEIMLELRPVLYPDMPETLIQTSINRWIKTAKDTLFNIPAAAIVARLTRMDPKEMPDPRVWAGQGFSEKEFMERLKVIDKLREASEAAPTDINRWREYHNKLNAFTAKLTAEQKEMASDMFGHFDNVAQYTDSQFLTAFKRVEALKKAAEKSGDFAAGKRAAIEEAKLQEHATDEQLAGVQFLNEQVTLLSNSAFMVQFNNLQKLKKAADKSNDISVIAAYYRAYDALSKSSSDEQMRSAEDLFSRQEQLREEAKANREQDLEEARQRISTMTSTVMGIYESALQRSQSQLGTLFQGPFMQSAVMQNRQQFGFAARPQDLLQDLRSQVTQFGRFRGSLDRLGKRGAPVELVDQLRELGPESQKAIDQLLRMTPGMFTDYVKAFKQGQADAATAARQDLERQLAQWHRFGRSVALAIASGLRSENVALETALRNMILRMFPGAAGQANMQPQPAPASKRVEFHWHGEDITSGNIMSQFRKAHFLHRNDWE